MTYANKKSPKKKKSTYKSITIYKHVNRALDGIKTLFTRSRHQPSIKGHLRDRPSLIVRQGEKYVTDQHTPRGYFYKTFKIYQNHPYVLTHKVQICL